MGDIQQELDQTSCGRLSFRGIVLIRRCIPCIVRGLIVCERILDLEILRAVLMPIGTVARRAANRRRSWRLRGHRDSLCALRRRGGWRTGSA